MMKNIKPKVILLVAGEGKRLRPYTSDRPKCMVEVEGVSLIDRQLEVLKSEGLDEIVMIGGYKSDMLKREGIRLKLNPQYFETNMVWTLFCAEEELVGDVIISYGDIVYSRKILQALLKSKEDISVIIDKEWESYWQARNENPLDDAETLKLREDGTISEIGQKPKSIDQIEGQYIGLMKFSEKGVKLVRDTFHAVIKNSELQSKAMKNAYMTDLLQTMINSGIEIASVPVSDSWIEVDTVSDFNSEVTLKRLKKIHADLA
jgi:choline kinase